MMSLSRIFVAISILTSLQTQAETLHYKGRSAQADKNGNSVCRVYIERDQAGKITSVRNDGYMVEDYKPGMATRLLGDSGGREIEWGSSFVDIQEMQVKEAAGVLTLVSHKARPVEDTQLTKDIKLKLTTVDGIPTETDLLVKEKRSLGIFTEYTTTSLKCKNLKFVEAR